MMIFASNPDGLIAFVLAYVLIFAVSALLGIILVVAGISKLPKPVAGGLIATGIACLIFALIMAARFAFTIY